MSIDLANLRKRLSLCFQEMFGDALPEDVTQSRMENVKGWDSMATWMLLMLVQEKLSVRFGLDQIPKLTSYAFFERYVAQKLGIADERAGSGSGLID